MNRHSFAFAASVIAGAALPASAQLSFTNYTAVNGLGSNNV